MLRGFPFPWPLVPRGPSAPWWCLRHHQVLKGNSEMNEWGKEKTGLLTETSPLTSVPQSHQMLCTVRGSRRCCVGLLGVRGGGGGRRWQSRRLCSSWSTWSEPRSAAILPQKVLKGGWGRQTPAHSTGHGGAPWRKGLSLVLVWSSEDSACSSDSASLSGSIPSPCPLPVCLLNIS